MAENCVLLKGLFISGGKEHQLNLSDNGLHWHIPTTKTGTTGIEVPWSDIYGLSTDHNGEPTLASSDRKHFTVHFITHRKDKKWRATEKKFEVKEGNVADWVTQIQSKFRPGTPRSLLVIVNPIGGKGDGRQVYQKKVATLFQTASITTQVFVTERAKHAEEIINNFDFSKVEGLVTVGGDGMYQEAMNALVQRVQKEAGINIDNPENIVKPLENIKVGIIPTGTGNGVSGWACDVIDVETAILHIIKGETKGYNIFSIHEEGKLLTYSGLLFGYGFCSDMIKETEDKRWMKRFRYPYVMLTKAFGKKRVYSADIEYLESGSSTDTQSRKEESEGAAALPPDKDWKRLERKEYMDVMTFVAGVDLTTDKVTMHPSSDTVMVCLSEICGGFAHLKLFYSLFTGKKEGLEAPHLTLLKNVVGLRIKVKVSEENSPKGRREKEQHYLDVDGEVYRIENLDIEVRLHPRVIPFFSSSKQ